MSGSLLLVFPEEQTGDFTRNHPPPVAGPPPACRAFLAGHQATLPLPAPAQRPQVRPHVICLFFGIDFASEALRPGPAGSTAGGTAPARGPEETAESKPNMEPIKSLT